MYETIILAVRLTQSPSICKSRQRHFDADRLGRLDVVHEFVLVNSQPVPNRCWSGP